jgi:Sulfotransferase domain
MPRATRYPDFFIIGHPKSGTTALYRMLKRHPQIYVPGLKEPWFFASDLRERRVGTVALPQTPEEYLSLFADATPEQRVGEGSPSYLLSHTAAGAIAEAQPAARCIAVLREPASFLHSLHLQFVQVYTETESDLRKAMSLEAARREGRHIPRLCRRPPMLQYAEHVRYVEQLRRYHALFPPEQLLVLLYDDFRRDNEAAVRTVWRFLDVEDTQPVLQKEANPTVRVRSQRLHALMYSAATGRGRVSRGLRSAARALAPRGLDRQAVVAVRNRLLMDEPRAPDERLVLELRRRFEPEVVALSEYLDRDLVSLWGYDRLG